MRDRNKTRLGSRLRQQALPTSNDRQERRAFRPRRPALTDGQSNSLRKSALAVRWLPIASLIPYERNPRTHSSKQIAKIAASIREFDFIVPAQIDKRGRIIAGHGRIEAAKQLGWDKVPTIRIEHLSEAQQRLFRIADNRLTELAIWNEELLATELKFLSELEIDFDVEITGFETAEIDNLIEGHHKEADVKADQVPDVDTAEPPVSRIGDLWALGKHSLLCGSALDAHAYKTVMAGHAAHVVFVDPPYNVAIKGHASGLGRIKHRDFVMASGEMSEPEYIEFLTTAFRNLANASMSGAIHFVCIDWRHVQELISAGRSVYSELKQFCIWVKDNAGMGSLYRSQHELVLVFKNGSAPHINNVQLGQYGRYRTNVWRYAGVNSSSRTGSGNWRCTRQ